MYNFSITATTVVTIHASVTAATHQQMVLKELTINVTSKLSMLIKWYKDTMAGLH